MNDVCLCMLYGKLNSCAHAVISECDFTSEFSKRSQYFLGNEKSPGSFKTKTAN